MKCRFEHDEDCCNSDSPQYMCKCKPDVCHSVVPMTNADCIRAMTDEELAEMLSESTYCSPVTIEPCNSQRKDCWMMWLKQTAVMEENNVC